MDCVEKGNHTGFNIITRNVFENLLDMPLSVYKLQLSLYQICLENIGYKTLGRRILWLKPEGNYDKINLEEYTYTLRKDLIGKIK